MTMKINKKKLNNYIMLSSKMRKKQKEKNKLQNKSKKIMKKLQIKFYNNKCK